MCTISISDKGRHARRATQKQCWWVWNLSRKTISTHCSLWQKMWLFPEVNIMHHCFCTSFLFLFHKWFVSKRGILPFSVCGSLSLVLKTYVSPVVELFQQVLVQVRGADSSNLLVSDQCLQLFPGRLKISQTFAVPLQRPRRGDDNRVQLRYAQCLAGFKIREEQKWFKTPISLELGVFCVVEVTDSSPMSTASLMEDWTGSHRNSFTKGKKGPLCGGSKPQTVQAVMHILTTVILAWTDFCVFMFELNMHLKPSVPPSLQVGLHPFPVEWSNPEYEESPAERERTLFRLWQKLLTLLG